jgi:hypothetical protein
MTELEADGHEEDASRLRRKERFRRSQLIGLGLFLMLAFVRTAPAIVSMLHGETPGQIPGLLSGKSVHAAQSLPAASDEGIASATAPISLAGRSQTGSAVGDRVPTAQ